MKSAITLTALLAGASAQAAIIATYSTDWVGESSTGVTSSSQAIGPNFTQQDWETVDPGGSHNFVDIEATHSQVTGDRLLYVNASGTTATTTITLNGLPSFQSVSLDRFIVAAGGGLDHPQFDGIEVVVNGTSILDVDLTARDRDGTAGVDVGPYLASAPASIILEGYQDQGTGGSEFINTRTDGWGHDALYDLGADPAFDNVAVSGSGTITIDIIATMTNGTGGIEGGADEQIAVGNFGISFDDGQAVPEPSSALILGLSALALLRRRR